MGVSRRLRLLSILGGWVQFGLCATATSCSRTCCHTSDTPVPPRCLPTNCHPEFFRFRGTRIRERVHHTVRMNWSLSSATSLAPTSTWLKS